LRRIAFLLLAIAAPFAHAGEADVVDVKVRRSAPGVYDFDITVRSVDKGWEYYADAFEVLAPDGKVLGQRILLHPHETEQPFTRDLYGVRVPAGITEVEVRARHKPKGYGGKSVRLKLPDR
jgi:hypothetical protein